MFLIRNVEEKDLGDLLRLSRELDSVNLPKNAQDLKRIIRRSLESFAGKGVEDKTRAQYIFVMEDTETKKVIGTSQIFARHGFPKKPHVYFQVAWERVHSKTLGIRLRRKFYRLKADPKGYTEIGGLVLARGFRHHPDKLGKQLSYVRFLLMKAQPQRFKRRVIAELLPPLDKNHQSSLWNFYGHRLTHLTYRKADLMSSQNKEFILNLFPRGRLYYDLLPENVRADVEKTGSGSRVAKRLLTRIGFRYDDQIDPFDGGPYYVAPLHDIKVFRLTSKVHCLGSTDIQRGKKYFVLSERDREVRVMVTPIKREPKGIFLPKKAFDLLDLKKREPVYIYPWGWG